MFRLLPLFCLAIGAASASALASNSSSTQPMASANAEALPPEAEEEQTPPAAVTRTPTGVPPPADRRLLTPRVLPLPIVVSAVHPAGLHTIVAPQTLVPSAVVSDQSQTVVVRQSARIGTPIVLPALRTITQQLRASRRQRPADVAMMP